MNTNIRQIGSKLVSKVKQVKPRVAVIVAVVAMLVITTFTWSRVNAAPAFVQVKATTGSGLSQSVALPSSSAGNLLAIYVAWNSKSAIVISDSKGNTYAAADTAKTWTNKGTWKSQVWYAKNIVGGAVTVTASLPATGTIDLYATEYSGLDKSNPLDVWAVNTGTSATPSSGNATTTYVTDLLFGAGSNGGAAQLTSPGSGYTTRSSYSGNEIMDRVVNSTGSYNASATVSTSNDWVMHMVAFKAAPTSPIFGGSSDTTAPSVPANIQASTSSLTTATISWNASIDNVGVTGYKLYRNGVLIASPTGTSYGDASINVGTAYSYTVAAVDAAGNQSAQSPAANVYIADDNAPTNLVATAVSGTQINLTWNAPVNNVGITSYKLYRNNTLIASPTVTSYSDTGLTAGVQYSYKVSAVRDSSKSNAAATTTSTTTTPTPSPTTGQTFPRLGGMLIGGHNYYDATYQAKIAKLDMAILGMYNGWNGGGAATTVNQIKARNPNILLGNYTLMTEAYSGSDAAQADVKAKLSSEKGPNGVGDWWGYNSAGQHTNWSAGTYPVWDINLTLKTTPDSNGDRFPQWMAKRDNSKVISNANFDIWFSDNNFWQPRINDDWDRNGTNDSASSETVRNWWRDGQRAYYDKAKSLQPNKMLMVNADNDLDGSVFPSEANPFTQYTGVLQGAFMEHAFGKSWSAETWGGWSTVMGWYHRIFANLTGPKAVLIDAYMGDAPSNYQNLRYTFGATLMDNGYFSASSDYGTVLWYDEFDLAGASNTKWLGTAIDPPQTTAWSSGVYKRKFANGMVLVNPKGNGTRTVTVGPGYHRFHGNQAPTVNNGASVTSTVTLADRDALFLVKD